MKETYVVICANEAERTQVVDLLKSWHWDGRMYISKYNNIVFYYESEYYMDVQPDHSALSNYPNISAHEFIQSNPKK